MLQRTQIVLHLPQVQLHYSDNGSQLPPQITYCIRVRVRVRVRPMHNHRNLSTKQKSVCYCLNVRMYTYIYCMSRCNCHTQQQTRVRADDQTRASRSHATKCLTHLTPRMYVQYIGSWRETLMYVTLLVDAVQAVKGVIN